MSFFCLILLCLLSYFLFLSSVLYVSVEYIKKCWLYVFHFLQVSQLFYNIREETKHLKHSELKSLLSRNDGCMTHIPPLLTKSQSSALQQSNWDTYLASRVGSLDWAVTEVDVVTSRACVTEVQLVSGGKSPNIFSGLFQIWQAILYMQFLTTGSELMVLSPFI